MDIRSPLEQATRGLFRNVLLPRRAKGPLEWEGTKGQGVVGPSNPENGHSPHVEQNNIFKLELGPRQGERLGRIGNPRMFSSGFRGCQARSCARTGEGDPEEMGQDRRAVLGVGPDFFVGPERVNYPYFGACCLNVRTFNFLFQLMGFPLATKS